MASVVGSIARRTLEARNVRHKTNSRDCWNTFTTTRGTEICFETAYTNLSTLLLCIRVVTVIVLALISEKGILIAAPASDVSHAFTPSFIRLW